jgi:hypothetical protein
MSIRTLIASVVSQAPADSTPTSVAVQSNRQVARAASPAVSISFDETAQHGVGVEGVDGVAGPRRVVSSFHYKQFLPTLDLCQIRAQARMAA